MDDVLARVKRRLADEPAQPDPARVAAIIREEAVVISDIGVLDIMRKLRDDTTGAGPLEAILARIASNGPAPVVSSRSLRMMSSTPMSLITTASSRMIAATRAGSGWAGSSARRRFTRASTSSI